MADGPPAPPISDDELLYRRIPKSMNWYHPGEPAEVDDEAFRPHKLNDTTGLSFQRARSQSHPEFMTVEDAAKGPSKLGYVVAVLLVRVLRQQGILLEPRPIEGQAGHAEMPQLNSENRNSDQAVALMRSLAASVARVEDPSPTS
jgi:hypothetical protein